MVPITMMHQITPPPPPAPKPFDLLEIVDETDPEKTVIAAAKSDSTTSLINEVNTILDELRADGTLAELSNKYFGYDATKLPE